MSYGLYLIATQTTKGEKAGYVGNTAFQVTSDPPKLAISCHKNNYTTGKILESKVFSVSVLKKEASTSLIGEFGFMSGNETDKFHNKTIKEAVTGAPVILDSSVAWFDCRVVSTHDAGSHILIIGEVMDSEVLSAEEPMTYRYYREKYKMLAPKNAPTYIEQTKLRNEEEPPPEIPAPTEVGEKMESDQDTYTCTICGYQYNPEEGDPTAGIPPGTSFQDLPEDYKCPICNAGKEYFRHE